MKYVRVTYSDHEYIDYKVYGVSWAEDSVLLYFSKREEEYVWIPLAPLRSVEVSDTPFEDDLDED